MARRNKKKGGKDKIESHETSFSQLMKPGIALQLKTDGGGEKGSLSTISTARSSVTDPGNDNGDD